MYVIHADIYESIDLVTVDAHETKIEYLNMLSLKRREGWELNIYTASCLLWLQSVLARFTVDSHPLTCIIDELPDSW